MSVDATLQPLQIGHDKACLVWSRSPKSVMTYPFGFSLPIRKNAIGMSKVLRRAMNKLLVTIAHIHAGRIYKSECNLPKFP